MYMIVVLGCSFVDDLKSFIVFYCSYLGSFGNLVELILKNCNVKVCKFML